MTSEIHTLNYGDQEITYSVLRNSARANRIKINVLPSGAVNVEAPDDATEHSIRKAVSKRSRWIVQHVEDANNRFSHVLPREYVSGEMILYLGKRYMLKVIKWNRPNSSVKLLRGLLEVRVCDTSQSNVKAKMRAWYRVKAQAYFARRLNDLLDPLPIKSRRPAFELKLMSKRWGSCSVEGKLTLNPFLIKAPRECVDYVLQHELCHLIEHNHSAKFFALLDRHSPEWKRVKHDLDNMAEVIFNE